VNRRCKYYCDVEDAEGTPSFTIRVDDEEHKEQLVFRGKSPRGINSKGGNAAPCYRKSIRLTNRSQRASWCVKRS